MIHTINNNAIQGFYFFATIYSMGIIFTAFIIMSLTLPKIWSQKTVKNGLISLRRLLLLTGGTIWLLTLTSLIILGTRFYLPFDWVRPATYTLLMVFSTIVLVNAVAKHFIYTLNYSEKSIQFHKEFEKKERARTKKKS